MPTSDERLQEIHRKVRGNSDDGLAYEWGYDRNPAYIYHDGQTGRWLVASHVEGAYNLYPSDEFPHGMEFGEVWGDSEYVPVEETPLHHGVYGLDRAREGYGPVVG
jgi:hypothetical protein